MMLFRLLILIQLLVLSYGFIRNQNIHRMTGVNVVCIDLPNGSNIPEKRDDLPIKKKNFFYNKVGNGRDNRMNETNYHETVAKMKENIHKMTILNQLDNENINIHDKIALYNKYQSDYVDKNYTPTKEGSELFERWSHSTYFFDGTN